MFKLVIVGVVATFARAQAENDRHPITPEFVEQLKEEKLLWQPYEYEENPFRHHTREEILGMLGLHITERKEKSDFKPIEHEEEANDLPA